MTLGLYDSGLGGLTVLAALRAAGITADVIYFADQAHVPYGDKSDAELRGYLVENLRLLASQSVDAVVMACNTSCAVAARSGWPSTAFPVLDLIANAGAAFAGTRYRRIGVVATAATTRSGAYERAIHAHAPHVEVVSVAAPALVPLVEQGAAETAEARDAVAAVVAALPRDLDALVYGCTHYPLLDRWFAAALGAGVDRIDPAASQAAAAVQLLRERGWTGGASRTTYFTNGDPIAFEDGIRRLGDEVAPRVGALIAG